MYAHTHTHTLSLSLSPSCCQSVHAKAADVTDVVILRCSNCAVAGCCVVYCGVTCTHHTHVCTHAYAHAHIHTRAHTHAPHLYLSFSVPLRADLRLAGVPMTPEGLCTFSTADRSIIAVSGQPMPAGSRHRRPLLWLLHCRDSTCK